MTIKYILKEFGKLGIHDFCFQIFLFSQFLIYSALFVYLFYSENIAEYLAFVYFIFFGTSIGIFFRKIGKC